MLASFKLCRFVGALSLRPSGRDLLFSNEVRQRLSKLRSALPSAVAQGLGNQAGRQSRNWTKVNDMVDFLSLQS